MGNSKVFPPDIMEKEYSFTVNTSADKTEVKVVKESELTDQQLDLLYGEFIHTWNNLPGKLRETFHLHISGM